MSTSAADASSAGNYVTEFNPDEAPQLNESNIRPIAPIPNEWMKKPINLPNLPSTSQTNGSDSRPAANGGLTTPVRCETMLELRRRDFKEYLKRLPEDNCMDGVPVEGFGLALLSGYGWKQGQGIGLNAKEDIKVSEVIKKTGRGRLAFLHNRAGEEDRKGKKLLI